MDLMGARPTVRPHRARCFSLFCAAAGLQTTFLQRHSVPLPIRWKFSSPTAHLSSISSARPGLMHTFRPLLTQ